MNVTKGSIKLTGSSPADGKAVGAGDVNAILAGYNEATYDRWRSNTGGTLLASAARTATTLGPVTTNYNARGLIVYLDVTVASGTGGLTIEIKHVDPASGKGFKINDTTTTVLTTIRTGYEVSPGGSTAGVAGDGNIVLRVAGSISRSFQVAVVVADASSYTYSLGYSLII